jgi:hypothetical protein
MSLKVVRCLGSETLSSASPLEAIRAAADPGRFVRAKRTGEQIKGATILWLHATLRRVTLGLSDGQLLSAEPTESGDVEWNLQAGDVADTPAPENSDLPPSGEIEFLMPEGFIYTWRWRHIRDLIVGSVVVMCSAERRVVNVHCRGVEFEIDCYEIERGGAIDRILVFAPF